MRIAVLAALALAATVTGPVAGLAEPVAVRFTEGIGRGFPVLRDASGEKIAQGDLSQIARGDRVENRLTFRFRDGSLYDETAVFTQQKVFTLQSYHLVQRGPTFPEEIEVTLTRERGAYQVRSRKHGAEPETVSGEVELPPDTYNGMMTTLLKNLAKGAVGTVHMLVFTPKPMLVQLEVVPVGEDTIIAGERRLQATHYVMTPKLGVVRGAAAALLGKTPPPYHCWVVTTGAPAFVALDGPLYTGGPIWRVETVSPRGPARPAAAR